MTETLTHHQIEQLLPAAALEILESQEQARIIAHARECADCARLLDSYREVVAGMAATHPEQPLVPARSARLRARLLARTQERSSSRPAVVSAAGSRRTTFSAAAAQWAGWAVAAALAGVLLVHHSIHRPVAYGWLAAGALVLVVIALAVYARIQQARLAALRRQLEPDAGRQEELQRTGGK